MYHTTNEVSWFNSLAVTHNCSPPEFLVSIYLSRSWITANRFFNVKERLKNIKAFISKLSVKVMFTLLLLFEIFSCNGSSTCLNFPAITYPARLANIFKSRIFKQN